MLRKRRGTRETRQRCRKRTLRSKTEKKSEVWMRELIIMQVQNFRYKRQRRTGVTSDGVWSVLARPSEVGWCSRRTKRTPRLSAGAAPTTQVGSGRNRRRESARGRTATQSWFPPRRLCFPGKSTSGWTTLMCRVRASFLEKVFSSVQSAHLTFCLRALWIVSSCRVRS